MHFWTYDRMATVEICICASTKAVNHPATNLIQDQDQI